MTAKEFHSRIYDIITNSSSPETERQKSNHFFFQLKEDMKEYARIKCLEAIRNTRYQAIDIITHHIDTQFNLPVEENDVHDLIRVVQNIPNQDVMPEL